MRIRRWAKLLARDHQDEAPSLQQRGEELPVRDWENKKEVEDKARGGSVGGIIKFCRERKRKINHFASNFEYDGDGKDDVMRDEKKKREEEEAANETGASEDDLGKVEPIGEIVRVSGEGKRKINHFASFEYGGFHYDTGDSVMFWPQKENQKPYVAIIKDIIQTNDKSMMVKVQWFYRPEDTEKKGGGNWESNDTRELFYSFHQDETPVESIMHKCIVHFIPSNKQIPARKQHPGFIVQKVYDINQKKLFDFADDGYLKNKRGEIHHLVEKTMLRLGKLPYINHKDQLMKKEGILKKK